MNKERKTNIIKALKRDRSGLEKLVESMRPRANPLYQIMDTFKPLLVIKEDKSEENPYKVRYVSDVFISFGEED